MFLFAKILVFTLLSMLALISGIDFSDPAVWGSLVGLALIGLSYIFAKARWILRPLGELLRAYAEYKESSSEQGADLSPNEREMLWENHVAPLLERIGKRIGASKLVAKIFGL